MQKELASAAARYGVDETSIASAIATENSLNVTLMRHQAQDWLAGNLGITSIPTTSGGRDFSLGIGEIHVDRAMEAEQYCAKLEHRAPRSDSEMIKEVENPLGAVRTAAMILRQAQDIYASHGFQIAHNPGILATVYNLGQPEQRAAAAQKAGVLPKVNFFGLFTQKNYDEVKSTIGANTVAPVQTVAATTPPSAVRKLATASHSSTAKTTGQTHVASITPAPQPQVEMSMQTVVTAGIPLATAPSACQDSGDSGGFFDDGPTDPLRVNYAPPSGTINSGETVTELGRTLDCDSKVWKLVKSSSGAVGWTSDDKLTASTASRMAPKTKCTENADSKCSVGIASDVKPYLLTADGTTRDWLKPFSKSDHPGFKTADNVCTDESVAKIEAKSPVSPRMQAFGGGAYTPPSPTPPLFKSADIDQNRKLLDSISKIYQQELKKMSSDLKINQKQLLTAENPYSAVAQALIGAITMTSKCAESLSAERSKCQGMNLDPNNLKTALAALQFKKKPMFQDVQQAGYGIQAALSGNNNNGFGYYGSSSTRDNYYDPSDSMLKALNASDIRNALNGCVDKLTTVAGTNSQAFDWQIKSIRQIAKDATDQEILGYGFYLVSAARLCNARMNLMEGISATPAQSASNISCAQPPEILSYNDSQFMKDFARANLKDQNFEFVMISDTLNSMLDYSTGLPNLVSLIQMRTGGNGVSVIDAALVSKPREPSTSYCPNRTAEFIEDLIKDNPCVEHVYIPSRWIAYKLRDYSSKVIYRNFDQADRYLVEYGGSTCGQ